MNRLIITGCSLLLFCGCASQSRTASGPPAGYQKAVEVFGGKQNLYFLRVTSNGPLTDAAVSGLTAAHPSAMSKKIGQVVGSAQNRRVDFGVTGESSLLTKITVIRGLEIHNGKRLPNLRVLFIGEESDRDAVEKAVRQIGGEFFFVKKSSL